MFPVFLKITRIPTFLFSYGLRRSSYVVEVIVDVADSKGVYSLLGGFCFRVEYLRGVFWTRESQEGDGLDLDPRKINREG